MDRLPYLLIGRQPPQEKKKQLPPPPTYATTNIPTQQKRTGRK